jgi:protoheme IX farnesyltransferase
MPNVAGQAATNRAIVLYSALLSVVAIAPWPLGMAGVGYGIAATLCSLGFMGYALLGWRGREPHFWARRLFFLSMPYLVVVFAAFVASRA